MKLTIYGASDDLVEIDGDSPQEFDGDSGVLAFSDGTLLLIDYGDAGTWDISRLAAGMATYEKVDAESGDSDLNYSDRVTLIGEFQWVVWSPKDENGHRFSFMKAARS